MAIAQQISKPFEGALANGEYVVSVSPGFEASDALVGQLNSALIDRDAAIAIASPFARGGRLCDSSWLARMATSWLNGFLSIAAHGEIATVIGTIRVYRREALERILAVCPGVDLDSEVVILEARRQRLRVVEVPAVLRRMHASSAFSVYGLRAAASRLWAQVRSGLRYRPALWLALPGLIPGLLPLVIALLLVAHASPAQVALWTFVTLVVQYGSLAIFSWQTSTFVVKRWLRQKPV